jgi:hypothetical protein
VLQANGRLIHTSKSLGCIVANGAGLICTGVKFAFCTNLAIAIAAASFFGEVGLYRTSFIPAVMWIEWHRSGGNRSNLRHRIVPVFPFLLLLRKPISSIRTRFRSYVEVASRHRQEVEYAR